MSGVISVAFELDIVGFGDLGVHKYPASPSLDLPKLWILINHHFLLLKAFFVACFNLFGKEFCS